MSVSPVMSITDELVSELERSVECVWPETDQAVVALRAMLAERAELLRDTERYRWLRDRIENNGDMVIAKVSEWSIESWSGDDPGAAIDAAMQSEADK